MDGFSILRFFIQTFLQIALNNMTQMAPDNTKQCGREGGRRQTSGCDMKYWFLKDAIMTVLPQQGLQFGAYFAWRQLEEKRLL